MTQASGSQASISIWEELTYGVRPTSPAMFKIKSATSGVTLKTVVEKLVSNAMTGLRGVSATRAGNLTLSGALPFELPLLSIGKLLKHAIGTYTGPVPVKLVALATGLTNVTVLCADTAAPAGAGTITHTGTTLTWAAQGETAGTAVDVSVPGNYTLQSSIASHALYIMVTSTVVGTSAVATVGAAAYKHVLTRGLLPVGFGAEIAYNDIAQYNAFDGLRVDQLSLTVANSGIVTGSMNLVGTTSTMAATPTGTPTALTHVPFVQHEAQFMEGGQSAKMSAFSFTLTNDLDPVRSIGSRTIISAREGMGDLTGKITTLFQDATYINKVINETASSINVFFGASNGTGSVNFNFPNVKYFGDAGVGISTDKGIVYAQDFEADNSVGATDITVTIINSEATL